MVSELETRVLAAFFPKPTGKTIKEIEALSGYSYERVNTALKGLEKTGIVHASRAGVVLTYDLVTGTDEAFLGFVSYEMGRRKSFRESYRKADQAVSELLGTVKCDVVILFGSYAKGNQTESSDIDVFIIGDEPEADAKALSLRHKWGQNINAVSLKRDKFSDMPKDNPHFYQDLVEFGIVLKGLDAYYEMVYR
jgi:predicted nucleotidyltransferase